LFDFLTDTSVGLKISIKIFKLCSQVSRTSMFHFDLEVSHNFYLLVHIQHEEITIGAK
jgi:nucleosome binding factor SPN SPT16 subunit